MRRRRSDEGAAWQLVIDSSYTYEDLVRRDNLQLIDNRRLAGMFGGVCQVHAFRRSPEDGFKQCVQIHLTGAENEIVEILTGPVRKTKWKQAYQAVRHLRRCAAELKALNERHPFSVVRASDPSLNGLLAWWFSRRFSVPLVVRVSSDLVEHHARTGEPTFSVLPSPRVELAIARFVLRRANLVLAPNHKYAAFARSLGAPSCRVHVVGYGAMLSKLHDGAQTVHSCSPCPYHGGHEGAAPPYAVAVLRLEPDKVPGDLVDVLDFVRQADKDLHLLILGSGSLQPSLEADILHRNLQDRIHLLGDVSQRDVNQYMMGSVAVLSPMTGRALLEAALCGCAIVGYDHDWQSEVITHGKTGLLVSYRDTRAMAANLLLLLESPSLRHAIGEELARTARSQFGVARSLEREREAYLTL